MSPKPVAERLFRLAQEVAADHPGVFVRGKGPGKGNHATNAFMADLRKRAAARFGADHAERAICGENGYSGDYYFQDEATIVEVALGLPNPHTEFERDVVKAVMAKDVGYPVERLFFISKLGAVKECHQPGRADVARWAHERPGIRVEVHELRPGAA